MAKHHYPNARIAIFAKAPVTGTVKTRMQPALSEQQSALLQSKLIEHTIKTASNSRVAPVQLWCAPNTRHPAFLRHKATLELKTQQGSDLGQRMQGAFEENKKYDFTILIGTDCPLLSADDFYAAARAILHCDICITPAHDGGYVLIASQQTPKCFDNINWGSDEVLTQSLSALNSFDQSSQLLNTLPDLDHPEDFAALPDTLVKQLNIEALSQLAKQYTQANS